MTSYHVVLENEMNARREEREGRGWLTVPTGRLPVAKFLDPPMLPISTYILQSAGSGASSEVYAWPVGKDGICGFAYMIACDAYKSDGRVEYATRAAPNRTPTPTMWQDIKCRTTKILKLNVDK